MYLTHKLSLLAIFSVLFFTFSTTTFAQYVVNGNSTQDNCNCYTLTPDVGTQYGSVWNINKISLNNSFDFNFTVFLGYNDAGADGIAFVLQPISTSVGSSGGGLGFGGITPSLGVTIDTYQNSGDPSYDHIAYQKNGDVDHNTANNIAGPVQALAGSANIEDGAFHTFRVVWNAATKQLDSYLDGVLRLSSTIDMVGTIFNNDPMVFWGFTGSTGGAKNLQRFCTKNIANFSISNPQVYCDNATITFADASLSSSNVLSWHWDFGDGTTSTTQSPTHHYAQVGTYNAKLYVVGNDGCNSDTSTVVINVYPKPTADFSVADICSGKMASFVDNSTVSSGSITGWNWDFGTNPPASATTQSPTHLYNQSGTFNATLIASSNQGCKDTVTKQLTVFPNPIANFTVADVCAGVTSSFTDNSTISAGTITNWDWNFGTNPSTTASTQNATHLYPSGTYNATLIVTSDQGCKDTLVKQVTVNAKPIADFTVNKTEGCSSFCPNFMDNSTVSSGSIASWSWDFGNGTKTDKNPTQCFDNNDSLPLSFPTRLIVTSDKGCSDTLLKNNYITVYSQPDASFSASPLVVDMSNSNVDFVNSSTNATAYSWNFGDNSGTSNEINVSHKFPITESGKYKVILTATNSIGCKDTMSVIITVQVADPVYVIPNVFSPNADGFNDTLKLINPDYIAKVETILFNRWGNVVLNQSEPTFFWNGKVDNGDKDCSDGVYFYKMKITGLNGKEFEEQGCIHLVR